MCPPFPPRSPPPTLPPSETDLYIVLEFVENGSLSDLVKQVGRFPEPLIVIYMSQVLQGLAYLHDQGVVHRDIKGANVLATKAPPPHPTPLTPSRRPSSSWRTLGSPPWPQRPRRRRR